MPCYIEQVIAPTHMLLVVIVAVIAVGIGVGLIYGEVPRGRLERFASRQHLPVTATNGNQVIAYLATTRRWRATGVIAGLVVSVLVSLGDGRVEIGFLWLFAGWFVGALVAEVRVAHLARGARRQASLQPRTFHTYLPAFAWHLVPATAALATLITAACVALSLWYLHHVNLPVLAWYAVAMGLAALVRVTQLRVLRRPQPVAAADVIAGDDAIRSRSLHVLAGGGATLIVYCALNSLAAVDLGRDDPWIAAASVALPIGVLATPLLGLIVATNSWRVRRPVEAL